MSFNIVFNSYAVIKTEKSIKNEGSKELTFSDKMLLNSVFQLKFSNK